uniref:Uncharacterized protein n=1 Tax=uncultured marine virus TaxID=186617 RepID=A0A0F7L0E3_9VIRU|nr:hypothetical protein [uncultured marine virus]
MHVQGGWAEIGSDRHFLRHGCISLVVRLVFHPITGRWVVAFRVHPPWVVWFVRVPGLSVQRAKIDTIRVNQLVTRTGLRLHIAVLVYAVVNILRKGFGFCCVVEGRIVLQPLLARDANRFIDVQLLAFHHRWNDKVLAAQLYRGGHYVAPCPVRVVHDGVLGWEYAGGFTRCGLHRCAGNAVHRTATSLSLWLAIGGLHRCAGNAVHRTATSLSLWLAIGGLHRCAGNAVHGSASWWSAWFSTGTDKRRANRIAGV